MACCRPGRRGSGRRRPARQPGAGRITAGERQAISGWIASLPGFEGDRQFATTLARGMELLLSLALHWAQSAKLPLPQALACVTSRAAAVLGQAASLTVGAVADVCVFDPAASNPINQDAKFAALSPFAHEISGFHLPGVVRATLVGGQLVFSS